MANPVPEIMPEEAHKAGVAVMATGRSDFPNQVNNALALPGYLPGALLITKFIRLLINTKSRLPEVIAGLVKNPSAEQIIPSVLNKDLVLIDCTSYYVKTEFLRDGS